MISTSLGAGASADVLPLRRLVLHAYDGAEHRAEMGAVEAAELAELALPVRGYQVSNMIRVAVAMDRDARRPVIECVLNHGNRQATYWICR